MKPKLVVAISALAIPVLAHAQPNVPKPTKADAQNVVQIITNDKAKAQAYCDLSKLSDQVEAAGQKNDTKKVETLAKQVDALVAKVGPEYSKLMPTTGFSPERRLRRSGAPLDLSQCRPWRIKHPCRGCGIPQ